MDRMKRWIGLVMAAALLALSGCAAAENLRVEFYDVGKADAMLITTPAGERILIDAATNKQGKKLVERFQKAGVDTIDAMIITHYDKDHVGGADRVLEEMKVGAVIMPVYDKESKQHTQFVEALAKHPPKESIQLITGEETTFSLAVRVQYGDTKFFFTGDAENARQKELLLEGDVACDVLKVPYHGRFENISPMFLAEAKPKIAYIHDDTDDPADAAVIDILEELGAEVYCAKDDGDLTVLSDGKTVWTE